MSRDFSKPSLPAALGLVIGLLGALIVTQWWLRVPVILANPFLSQLRIHAGLVLLAGGVALVARTRQHERQHATSRLSDWCAAFMVLYPAIVQAQTIFGIQLGLDFVREPIAPTLENPHPGRMAPNAAVAFIAAGSVLAFLRRPEGAGRPATRLALWIVSVLGFGGLAGHLLGLEQLYRVVSFNLMLLSTAAGISLLAVGLWSLQLRLTAPTGQDVAALERHIARRTVFTLCIVALAAGGLAFAVMRASFVDSLLADARASARTSSIALANTLQTSIWFPRNMASRPSLVQVLSELEANVDDETAKALADGIALSFLSAGTDGVKLLAADGRVLAKAGDLPAETSKVVNKLQAPSVQAELRWANGYVLHVEAPVEDAHRRVVGRVISEQRLHLIGQILSEASNGETADALLCSREAEIAVCAPSRLYATQYTLPIHDALGKPAYPMSRALLNETGAMSVKDLRGVPVVAGYSPVGDTGLGLVVKSDVSALYAPLRDHLHLVVLLVGALVAAGAWTLRARVRPLLQAVVEEQQRTRTILDTSSDAFIATDVNGRVTDWNAEATRLFGWTSDEAVGKVMSDLIVPPALREVHQAGFSRFLRIGTGPVVNRRTEMTGWHRDGYEIAIELSISGIQTGRGYVANAFIRDIRARRAAQHQLEASELRLHEVLGNIPAMVAHFDAEERCLFANDLALKVHGLTKEQAIGRRFKDGVSRQAYALHREHIAQVLSGKKARFEGEEIRDGISTFYEVNLVPEHDADGAVSGFYLMTFDISQMKQAKLEADRSSERLRAIADNLPVMISYIDDRENLQFANRTFEQWTGVPVHSALGRPLRNVIGDALFSQREQPLRQALAGQRVEFEVESVAMGVERVLQTVFIPDVQSVGHVRGVYTLTSDVTALRHAERKMADLARSDPLTGLANRRRFDEWLPEALARARRQRSGLGLMFLDVDHFKQINDKYGHAAGDAVLIEFGQRLKAAVRSTDLVARLAGDEFVVVLEGLHEADECEHVAAKIVAGVRAKLLVDGDDLSVTTSLGVAYLPAQWRGEPSTLLELADRALYQTKEKGRNGFTCTTAAGPQGFAATTF